jgi:hypothetical protein
MKATGGRSQGLARETETRSAAPHAADPTSSETTCPQCGESHDLAKVKGCIKCLKCGFKFDCNGW